MPKLSRRDIDAAAWDVFAGNQLPDSHLVLRTRKTEGANQSLKSSHRYTPQPLDWGFDLVLESSHRVHTTPKPSGWVAPDSLLSEKMELPGTVFGMIRQPLLGCGTSSQFRGRNALIYIPAKQSLISKRQGKICRRRSSMDSPSLDEQLRVFGVCLPLLQR
jgi:hypothetical protein